MANSSPESTLTTHLLTSLIRLSSTLVQTRLDAPDEFKPKSISTQAAPILATLLDVNRIQSEQIREWKEGSLDSRLVMEQRHLGLQNLMFEKNHLEREILACEGYESEYTQLPMIPLEEFLRLARSSERPAGLEIDDADVENILNDEHALMLARLQFELNERKRLDMEKKELSKIKNELVKENELKKARLDELEQRLDQFVKTAKSIQSTMHGEESMLKPTTMTTVEGMGQSTDSANLLGDTKVENEHEAERSNDREDGEEEDEEGMIEDEQIDRGDNENAMSVDEEERK